MNASITYNKALSVITESNGQGSVSTYKISAMPSVLSGLNSFSMRLSNTCVKKTLAKIEAAGFNMETVVVDKNWGFEWECKITAERS